MRELLRETNLVKELRQLIDFVELAQSGLGSAIGTPRLMAAVQMRKKASGEDERGDYVEQLAKAENLKKIAEAHIERDFEYLYALAVVKIWSVLESSVENIVLQCLQRPFECKDLKAINDLRGPLIEFLNADQDERAEFLFSELKSTTKSALKTGVAVFEALLEPVGMAGSHHEEVRRNILELQQTRHVIVHRRGLADRRFMDRCPWVGATVGQSLITGRKQFLRYAHAVMLFDIELCQRSHIRACIEVPQSLLKGRGDLLEQMSWE